MEGGREGGGAGNRGSERARPPANEHLKLLEESNHH